MRFGDKREGRVLRVQGRVFNVSVGCTVEGGRGVVYALERARERGVASPLPKRGRVGGGGE